VKLVSFGRRFCQSGAVVPFGPGMYRKLDADQIVGTVRRLRERVAERFPDSGLSRVSLELEQVASTAAARASWIAQRNYWLRGCVIFFILAFGAVLFFMARQVRVSVQVNNIAELLQGVDAGLNMLILLGGAIFFLISLEQRIKRRRALKAVHELRSLAHVVDMHQITKDPELLLNRDHSAAAQRKRSMSCGDLGRYLGLCSEMLTLISKVAALHVQDYDDPVVLSAVDQIEDLTTSLCNKIWQKIMILEQMTGHISPQPL